MESRGRKFPKFKLFGELQTKNEKILTSILNLG